MKLQTYNLYQCLYHYKKGSKIYIEQANILSSSPEQAKELILSILHTDRLEYWQYQKLADMVYPSLDVIEQISLANYERVKRKETFAREQNKNHLYPDNQKLEMIQATNDRLSPKPLLSSDILQKYL